MSVPLQDVLLVLLAAYAAYSYWAGLNPHLPLYAALLALAVAAIADWSGAVGVADSLGLDVVFFLAAGVGLIALDRVRPRPRSTGRFGLRPGSPAADATHQRQPSAEGSFDHLEGEAVPVVDAPGQDHDRDERPGDPEPQHG